MLYATSSRCTARLRIIKSTEPRELSRIRRWANSQASKSLSMTPQINSGMGEDLGLNASEHFSVSSAGAEMLRPLYFAHAILKHIH